MTAKNYSLLAAVIFTIVAILQLARAIMGVQPRCRLAHDAGVAELDRVCSGRHACLARI